MAAVAAAQPPELTQEQINQLIPLLRSSVNPLLDKMTAPGTGFNDKMIAAFAYQGVQDKVNKAYAAELLTALLHLHTTVTMTYNNYSIVWHNTSYPAGKDLALKDPEARKTAALMLHLHLEVIELGTKAATQVTTYDHNAVTELNSAIDQLKATLNSAKADAQHAGAALAEAKEASKNDGWKCFGTGVIGVSAVAIGAALVATATIPVVGWIAAGVGAALVIGALGWYGWRKWLECKAAEQAGAANAQLTSSQEAISAAAPAASLKHQDVEKIPKVLQWESPMPQYLRDENGKPYLFRDIAEWTTQLHLYYASLRSAVSK